MKKIEKVIKTLQKAGVSQEVIDKIKSILNQPETQSGEPGPGPQEPDPDD